MRKLIEIQREHLIMCDNVKCDYTVPYSESDTDVVSYINKPCPICGENLLTLNDYLQHLNVMKVVNFINKWFSWITIFYSKKSLEGGKTVSVHVHNGINITQCDDNQNK